MARSLAFPFGTSVTGGIKYTDNAAERAAAEIINVVTTRLRERVMRPDYGVGISEWLFEPNDDLTWGEIKTAVSEGIARWVPSVRARQIDVGEGESPATLVVKIAFTLAEEIDGEVYLVSVGTDGDVTEVR